MYLFFLVLFVLVSFILVFCILLQPGQGFNNATSFSSKNRLTVFGNMYRNNFIINIISIFSCVFLILSVILCNISNNKIKNNFYWEHPTKIINNYKKSEDIKK